MFHASYTVVTNKCVCNVLNLTLNLFQVMSGFCIKCFIELKLLRHMHMCFLSAYAVYYILLYSSLVNNISTSTRDRNSTNVISSVKNISVFV